jgi:hypothetical protein
MHFVSASKKWNQLLCAPLGRTHSLLLRPEYLCTSPVVLSVVSVAILLLLVVLSDSKVDILDFELVLSVSKVDILDFEVVLSPSNTSNLDLELASSLSKICMCVSCSVIDVLRVSTSSNK